MLKREKKVGWTATRPTKITYDTRTTAYVLITWGANKQKHKIPPFQFRVSCLDLPRSREQRVWRAIVLFILPPSNMLALVRTDNYTDVNGGMANATTALERCNVRRLTSSYSA